MQHLLTISLIAIVLTAGTAFLMWLGEQITEKGIGNGISILIFAGIVAAYSETYSHDLSKSNLFMREINCSLTSLKCVIMLIVIVADYCRSYLRSARYSENSGSIRKTCCRTENVWRTIDAYSAESKRSRCYPGHLRGITAHVPDYDRQFWSTHMLGDMDYRIICTMTSRLVWCLYVLLIIGFTFFYTFVQINPAANG